MAFERPTLPDLIRRIQADLTSRLEFVGGVLRRAVVTVIARVMAGVAHMLHGHLEYLSKQLFPDRSDESYLLRQASIFGITKRAATYSTLTAEATGDGTTVPAGTILVSTTGAQYEVDDDATGTTLVLALTSLDAGADTRLIVDDVLTFETPISGVNSTALVTEVVTDGNDEESTEELRERLRARMADAPRGGTVEDYVAWAKEVAGVTRVWVTAGELGPGTIVVRFARDDDPSQIPDSGEVATVQAYLESVAPAHALVTAHAPTDAPVNMTIHISPDTVALRAAVTAELDDYIVTNTGPGTTLLRSGLLTTIGNSGVDDYTLTLPATDTTFTTNQLPSLGTITWT